MSISAGWYTDPMQFDRRRYWDGADWTEHTAEMPVVASALPVVAQPSWVSDQAAAAQPSWAGPSYTNQFGEMAPQGAATATLEPAYGSGFGAASVYMPVPEPTTRSKLTREERDEVLRRANPLGWISIAVSIVALVANPYAAIGLAGAVLAIIGLIRSAGAAANGRGRLTSLLGLVVAIAATALFVWHIVDKVQRASLGIF